MHLKFNLLLIGKATVSSLRKNKEFIETVEDKECTFKPKVDIVSEQIVS